MNPVSATAIPIGRSARLVFPGVRSITIRRRPLEGPEPAGDVWLLAFPQ